MSTALGVQGCWSEQAQALLAGAAGTQHGGTCDRLCSATAGPAQTKGPFSSATQHRNIAQFATDYLYSSASSSHIVTLSEEDESPRSPDQVRPPWRSSSVVYQPCRPAYGGPWASVGLVSAKLASTCLAKRPVSATSSDCQSSDCCIEQECQRFSA